MGNEQAADQQAEHAPEIDPTLKERKGRGTLVPRKIVGQERVSRRRARCLPDADANACGREL